MINSMMIFKLPRTRIKHSSNITSSYGNITDVYQFYNRTEQNKNSYLEFGYVIYNHDLRVELLENIVGVRSDKYMTIWQALVFVDNIETYPVSLLLSFIKILIKIDALIDQLLGYQIEYEEYTTK
ncbi:unnamed protein product [Rotaria sordida]|uniref:Uncharacterized protein n=1 Tax=Rotaria sordida TaxID=392033 RepID=A0A814ETW9_9BILA|nr:unnamed protein product [Rotaria sordida]